MDHYDELTPSVPDLMKIGSEKVPVPSKIKFYRKLEAKLAEQDLDFASLIHKNKSGGC